MRILITGPCELAPLRQHLSTVPDGFPSGMPGIPVLSLVEELIEQGRPVTLVTLASTIREEMVAEGELLRVMVGPARPQGRARDAFRSERSYVAEAIKVAAPDVVHAHWTYEFALGALQSGRPTVVTVHDWGPAILRFHPHPYRVVRLGMQVAALRSAPVLTTVSPFMQHKTAKVARGQVQLIPNGLREAVFDQSSKGEHDEASPLFVSAAHGWSAYKNIKALLQAFSIVRAAMPKARLSLIGSEYGPGEAAHRWAQQRDLLGGVHLAGQLPHAEVVSRIREATALVHPSKHESFGLVVAEAMANCTPVIGGADSGGVPWVLDGGLAGLLCDVTDADAIANEMLRIATDARLRRGLVERAYIRAYNSFHIRRIAEQYLAEYERCAG